MNAFTRTSLFTTGLAGIFALASLGGCASREVVRDSQDPSIDAHALSTSLDKDDMQRSLHKLLNNLREARVMNQWRNDRGEDIVAIGPFSSSTSEHIGSQLDVMLAETETWLIESGVVKVIDRNRQLE